VTCARSDQVNAYTSNDGSCTRVFRDTLEVSVVLLDIRTLRSVWAQYIGHKH
jgi:hypothetical protein